MLIYTRLPKVILLNTDLYAFMIWYQIDPFLRLVDDSKLQAVNSGPDQVREVYGSKEDNEDALRSLSAIEISESQSKESFATMIVQTLGNSPNVSFQSHIDYWNRI